jgi:hypothetical protein
MPFPGADRSQYQEDLQARQPRPPNLLPSLLPLVRSSAPVPVPFSLTLARTDAEKTLRRFWKTVGIEQDATRRMRPSLSLNLSLADRRDRRGANRALPCHAGQAQAQDNKRE